MTAERRWKAYLLPWAWGAAAAMAAVTWLYPKFVGSDIERNVTVLSDRQAHIARLFSDKVESLARVAQETVSDTSLIHRSLAADPFDLAQALDEFSRIPLGPGQGLELVDARGSVLLWSGRTWVSNSSTLMPTASGERQAVVDRVGAVIVLRLGVPAPTGGHGVRIQEPLSVEALGLERVFGLPSFAGDIEEIAGRVARILPAKEYDGQVNAIPLVAFDRDTIAFALLPGLSTVAGFDGNQQFPGVLPTVLTLIALMLGITWLFQRHQLPSPWWWTGALVASIWAGRILLGLLAIPSRLRLGDAVDPRIYAAPSIGALTGTPMDLLLSAGVLAASVWLITRRSMKAITVNRPRWPLVPVVLGMLLGSGLLAYMTRGFVVAVRSLVYDSTVSLATQTVILPTLPELILFSSLFLLAISYAAIWLLAVRGLGWLARSIGSRSTVASWMWATCSIAAASAAFLVIDRSQIVPWWVFAYSLTGVMLIVTSDDVLHIPHLVRWIPHGAAILLMTIPLLDGQVHVRAMDEIQRQVEERVQPRDSWFSFVLTSDLRVLVTDQDAADVLRVDNRAEPGLTAFRLWSRTLLSQQKLNTGIAIFDRDGRERDRFMAGIGTYEQQAILRAVFDGNEEIVQTIDLQSGLETRTYHGAWSTVRGPGNQVYGTIVLLASSADQDASIMSTVGNVSSGEPQYRTLEYEGGKVVRTNDPETSAGSRLDPVVRQRLDESQHASLRVEDPKRRATAVYVRDPDDSAHLVVGVVEDMDVRWRVFTWVKIAFLYGLWGLCGALLSRSWRHSVTSLAGGFRARLFSAFLLIALVPLILLAIYNQAISTERTQRNVEQSLARDIGLVQQRLESTILGEEDLTLGLTDDFCAAVASDLGIEFSVFRAERIQASSRPELYASAVLESRMPAEAFSRVRLRGEPFVVTTERIGSVTYAVGYGSFFLAGRPAGIVAVPMLYRQAGIEEDLAERNAFLAVAAAGVFLLVLLLGGWLSGMIADPVRRLTDAIERIRAGRPLESLRSPRSDELGALMNAFDLMARELDESRRRIARAEREQAWREMAKQVAHEIKNPLTPMKLSVQHLRQAFQDRAPERETLLSKVVGTVLEQIDTLARIATEFSRFARLPERAFARVDVMGSIREAAALFSGVSGVTIQLSLAPTEAIVVADADELRRSFVNLFRNSIQAMDDKGVIAVTAHVSAGTLRVRIHDSGPGIPAGVRERVFEPSFSTKTDGMGLGLAIVRGVMTDLGGTIELQPTDSGAEFLILIPVHSHA